MDESIQDILSRCKKGDVTAQEKLYHMFAAKMWVVCRRFARDTEHAKDLLQEGFIVVFEKIHQFKGYGSLEGWIRRIFINMALAEYRKKRIWLYDINELPLQQDEMINDEELDELTFTEEELLEMIATLPPQYRLVFNLYAIENLSHKEIAKMLGISEGTSKSNLFRAREWLRKKITERKTLMHQQNKILNRTL